MAEGQGQTWARDAGGDDAPDAAGNDSTDDGADADGTDDTDNSGQ
jgi:hypothetical protein